MTTTQRRKKMKKVLILVLFFTMGLCAFNSTKAFAQNDQQQNIENMKEAGKHAQKAFEITVKSWLDQTEKLYKDFKDWSKDKNISDLNEFLEGWAIQEGFLKPNSCDELKKEGKFQENSQANKDLCLQFASADFSDTWSDIQTVINNSAENKDLVFILFDDFFRTAQPISYNSSEYKDSMIKLFNNPNLVKVTCSSNCLNYKLDKALKAFFMEVEKIQKQKN